MSNEELNVEISTMLLLRKSCTKMALDDLAIYTASMASILNVKSTILGCESPVLDRNDWIQSIIENPSDLQIQKWIFAWLFVRSNYKKLVSQLKPPDEKFEERFLEHHGLQYDSATLMNMKKNSKTCVCLLYNIRARTWREKMMDKFKNNLNLNLSTTAPKEIRGNNQNYRREPNTFFLEL